MGSSAKKKKEKRKDFQKPKLKVGKTKPKSSNFTDTSFKAKSIVLAQQSLASVAPSVHSQFEHHLSLLSHKSDTQKRESLAHLTSSINSRASGAPLPQPVAVIIPKVKHMICDGSHGVRAQLLKLLQSLPAEDISGHAHELLLWTHAAMTHMVADIRSSGLDTLNWLLAVSGEEVVSSAGGYVRTMKCFISVLGWTVESSANPAVKQSNQGAGGWSSTAISKPAGDARLLGKTLQTLTNFISIALKPVDHEAERAQQLADAQKWFPLTHTARHMIPKKSNAYGYLNLWGPPPDEDNAAYEDRDERQELFARRFKTAVDRGLEWARKEQGEVGRAAKALEKAVREGLEGYDG